jgi:hypothetical protein
MQTWLATVTVDGHERRVVFVQIRAAPLLELHDDIRRSSSAWVAARQDRVDAAAAQRKPVLEKDLDIPEASLDEVMR